MRVSYLAAIALALSLPLAASAQMLGGLAPISVSVDPKYPAPNSQATVSVTSNQFDLTRATLVVSVAGKEIYRGNARPVSVELGKAGVAVPIKVTVSSGELQYVQTVSIEPQDVALVAEPVSSAPPLYLGKPLAPLEGSVRFVAVANLRDTKSAQIDPTACSYVWTVDDTKISNYSGIGKDSLLVASPLEYRTRTVSVVVTSPSGSLMGGASVSFSPLEPSMRVYENDPLLGIRFDRALSGSYTITGAEDTFYAAPFSFPLLGSQPGLQWFLNGSSAESGPSITLRPTGSGKGSASLSVTGSTGGTTRAMANLSITFDTSSSQQNLFGL